MRAEYREEPCKVALNRVKGMGFKWSLNPYTGCVHQCTFCFVRAFELRADRPYDDRYGRSIRVKTNIVDVLRKELARKSWQRELVAFGTATDPYQPAEGRYRLTRGCIEALSESRTPLSLLTRGPLIVRDIDVLQEAATRVDLTVSFSVPTLDREVWRRTEPNTSPPAQRLRALRALIDAGIKAGIGMAPILPGLSDKPEQLTDVIRAARDAGAAFVWANMLYLRPGTREHFMEKLARDWPEEVGRYQEMYDGRAYLDRRDVDAVKQQVRSLGAQYGISDRRLQPLAPPPEPEQGTLEAVQLSV
jgi:DNA repair photolyase